MRPPIQFPRVDRRLVVFVLIGLAVGLGVAAASLEFSFFFGDPPLVRGIPDDSGSSFAGFRYFVQDGWHFPLLATTSLTDGTSTETVIALTDSLPLLALLAKSFRFLGLTPEHWIAGWFYGCFVAQGVAAALVAYTHEVRSRWSVVAMATLAATAPVFMLRVWHPGLFGQFTALLVWAAIGWFWHQRTLASAFWMLPTLLLALLMHPYFFVMCCVVAGGAVASAWLAKVLSFKQLVVWSGATGVTLLLAMYVFGYLPNNAVAPGGYGEFGMYPLGPVWPQWSRIWPGNEWLLLNRTGTFEGVNYLGAGGVLALVGAIVTQPRRIWRWIVRHQAFVFVLALLSAVAITHAIYLRSNVPYLPVGEQMIWLRTGTTRYLLLVFVLAVVSVLVVAAHRLPALAGARPVATAMALVGWGYAASLLVRPHLGWALLQQFRASGRFFWIIGYGLSLGSVIVLDRWLSGLARTKTRNTMAMGASTMAVMLSIAGVQYYDTTQYRSFVPTMFNSTADRVSLVDSLAALADLHHSIHLRPQWFCIEGPEGLRTFQDVVIAGSFANTPTDAYYGGRTDVNVVCDSSLEPPHSDTPLIVALHPFDTAIPPWLPAGYECRVAPGALLCSDKWHELPPDVLVAYPLFRSS